MFVFELIVNRIPIKIRCYMYQSLTKIIVSLSIRFFTISKCYLLIFK